MNLRIKKEITNLLTNSPLSDFFPNPKNDILWLFVGPLLRPNKFVVTENLVVPQLSIVRKYLDFWQKVCKLFFPLDWRHNRDFVILVRVLS